MIVVLMGYMGSGKSTIGKDLAKVLHYEFIDLDDFISDKENTAITDLFNTKGEIYFRKKETQYLSEILNTKDSIVLALGGGTPCYGNNLSILLAHKNVVTFYLKLSILSLVERLKKEQDQRPLIKHITTIEDLQEFIGKHLFERAAYYNQAKHTITSDNKSRKDVLEAILMRLI